MPASQFSQGYQISDYVSLSDEGCNVLYGLPSGNFFLGGPGFLPSDGLGWVSDALELSKSGLTPEDIAEQYLGLIQSRSCPGGAVAHSSRSCQGSSPEEQDGCMILLDHNIPSDQPERLQSWWVVFQRVG